MPSSNIFPSRPLVRSLESVPQKMPGSGIRKPSKRVLKLLVFIAVLPLALGLLLYFPLIVPAQKLSRSLAALKLSGEQLVPLIKSQDLGATQTQLEKIKSDLEIAKNDFSRLKWLKALPIVRNYYLDGERGFSAGGEILSAGQSGIAAIAPYADIIGLKGLTTTGDGAKTAQDRINFIVNTLDKLEPQFDDIGSHLAAAKAQVDLIDPDRYPENIKGIAIRSQITQGIDLLDQASTLVNDARPLLKSAPYILGIDSPRKYLVLFQNDAELRPTGGFMTAYAILQVDKGKISTIQSDDIYSLDAKFTKQIPAPDPIKKYLPKVPYWYLRDQNLSPDFRVSMETFFPNYQLTKSPLVDGIIAVNTQVLVELLKITGPIGVPGFGNFSAENDSRCNCPQVWYELELYADVEGPVVWDSISGRIIVQPKNYGDRKAFIGPMMHSVLANVMAQPKGKMGQMFTTIMNLFNQKHVLFYFTSEEAQTAAESFNIAGRIRETSGDFLAVVDTNFAGAKTNAWVTYSADSDIQITSSGTVTHTLTLTYKNPQEYFEDEETKLKLNGVFRDWLRVYVPKGSKLIEAKGFETGQVTTEDLGKTVFEGFFTLTPKNIKTITLKYEVPLKVSSPYRLLLQKQAGTKDFPYQISLNGKKLPEIILSADKEITAAF